MEDDGIVTNMDIVPLLLKKGEPVMIRYTERDDEIVTAVLIGVAPHTDNALLLSLRSCDGRGHYNRARGMSTFNDLNLSRHESGYWELR